MRNPPPRMDDMSIRNAMVFFDTYPNRSKCEMAEAILNTHLPMYENVRQAVENIIKEYRLNSDERTLFIALIGKVEKK